MDSSENSLAREKMPTSSAVVRERRWYLSILFMIAINFCLFMVMFYVIFKAKDYESHHSEYLGLSWGIFFIILIIITIALATPWPRRFYQRRTQYYDEPGSAIAKNLVNLSAGVLTFILIVLYLFVAAIPKYNKPEWKTSIEFEAQEQSIPAVAYVVLYNTTSPYAFDVVKPINNASVSGFLGTDDYNDYLPSNGSYIRELSLPAGEPSTQNYTLLIANASVVQDQFSDPLTDSLAIGINGTWNSSVPGSFGDIATTNLMVFDPRADVSKLLECSLVPWLSVSLFDTNSFTITASQIVDTQGIVEASDNVIDTEECNAFYRHLMNELHPPYLQFQVSLTASTDNDDNNFTSCDVSQNPNASCQTISMLQYGSQFITKYESVPGKDTLTMWVEIGAIVGAVQGVVWFTMLFIKA